jgi:cytochrome c oxidase subunit 2
LFEPDLSAPARRALATRSRLCLGALAIWTLTWPFSGCEGAQSTLDPAGETADQVADLFWMMTAGSVVIWLAVVGLAVHALVRRPTPYPEAYGRRLIIGGGVIVPTIVLAALLVHGLAMLPRLLAEAPPGSLRIAVTGEQFWWRVRYRSPDGTAVDLANEVRLPVREPVQFELTSPDVIHSFWIPAIAGKVDMIPGRTTQLTVRPTKLGVFNGVCAEYCGSSHAFMALRVVVLERPEFDRWLAEQRGPASNRRDADAVRGAELFATQGCGACHTVRGTAARGVVGPDLTHVGSRLTLGAGRLPNEAGDFERWLRSTEHLKPGVAMPHFGMLPNEHIRALAVHLESLQ